MSATFIPQPCFEISERNLVCEQNDNGLPKILLATKMNYQKIQDGKQQPFSKTEF